MFQIFKEALATSLQIVFSPQNAWQAISKGGTDFYKRFLFPLWILIAVSAFAGGWFVTHEGSFEIGLKNTIVEIFTVTISFFVTAFLLNEYVKKQTDVEKELKHTQKFVAYASSLMYLVEIIVSLVNDFFFLWLFVLYTFYIVYIGAEMFYKIIPERKTNFMLIASSLILAMPLLLKYCLSAVIVR